MRELRRAAQQNQPIFSDLLEAFWAAGKDRRAKKQLAEVEREIAAVENELRL